MDGSTQAESAGPVDPLMLLERVLAGTLEPERQQRDWAEQQLVGFQQQQGHVVRLLQLSTSSSSPPVRQAASIALKNFVAMYWDTQLVSDSDREAFVGAFLKTLFQTSESAVAKNLVLCVGSIAAAPGLAQSLLQSVATGLEHYWTQGMAFQVAVAIKALKAGVRAAGACMGSDDMPHMQELHQAVDSVLRGCLGLLQSCRQGDRRVFAEIEKLLLGVLRLGLQRNVLSGVFQTQQEADTALEAFLSILRAPIAEDDIVASFEWKSKARAVGIWAILVFALLESQPAQVTSLKQPLEASAGPFVQVLFDVLDSNASGSDAQDKCTMAILDAIRSPLSTSPDLFRQFIAPRINVLLSQTIPTFLGVVPCDEELVDADPEELAFKTWEEMKTSLQCQHGILNVEDCDDGCADMAFYQLIRDPTPRSSAMRTCRLLLSEIPQPSSLFLDFVKLIQSKLVLPETPDQVNQVCAALRMLAVACDAAASHPEAAAQVIDITENCALPVLVRSSSALTRATASAVLGRAFSFVTRHAGENLGLTIMGALMEALHDPSAAVRQHASLAFKECIWNRQLHEHLASLMPQITEKLATSAEQHLDNCAQILDGLWSCLYHFPGEFGRPVEMTPNGRQLVYSEQATAAAIERHGALLALFVERLQQLLSSQEGETALSENEHTAADNPICLCISTVHAIATSCPGSESPSAVYQEYVRLVASYSLMVLQIPILRVAVRNGLDAEVVDVAANVPSTEGSLIAALITRTVLALEALPAVQELLYPMLCDRLSPETLRLPVDGAEAQAPLHQWLVSRLEAVLERNAPSVPSWLLEVLASLALAAAMAADGSVIAVWNGSRQIEADLSGLLSRLGPICVRASMSVLSPFILARQQVQTAMEENNAQNVAALTRQLGSLSILLAPALTALSCYAVVDVGDLVQSSEVYGGLPTLLQALVLSTPWATQPSHMSLARLTAIAFGAVVLFHMLVSTQVPDALIGHGAYTAASYTLLYNTRMASETARQQAAAQDGGLAFYDEDDFGEEETAEYLMGIEDMLRTSPHVLFCSVVQAVRANGSNALDRALATQDPQLRVLVDTLLQSRPG